MLSHSPPAQGPLGPEELDSVFGPSLNILMVRQQLMLPCASRWGRREVVSVLDVPPQHLWEFGAAHQCSLGVFSHCPEPHWGQSPMNTMWEGNVWVLLRLGLQGGCQQHFPQLCQQQRGLSTTK